MITRSDPPLPLARWRTHLDLAELHVADLRFSLAETTMFLQQTLTSLNPSLPMPLSSEAITRLDGRTEGWVAGLRLLALALQGYQTTHEIEQMLATFTGSQQHILAYLVADVLGAQPEPLQTFLLQTSQLSRLTGSLCDAITGRVDSTRLLEHLARTNLFLTPLDATDQWYRYHGLFAEAMQHEARRRLRTEALLTLSDRASRWYETHGLPPYAIDAALAANNAARAASLMELSFE